MPLETRLRRVRSIAANAHHGIIAADTKSIEKGNFGRSSVESTGFVWQDCFSKSMPSVRLNSPIPADETQVSWSGFKHLVNVPLGTRILAIICSAVFVLQTILPQAVSYAQLCLHPHSISNWALWRLYTFPLLHDSLLHLILNMVTLVSLGALVEKKFGTLGLIHLVITLSYMSGILHSVLAMLLFLTGLVSPFYECTIGISGVLFAMIMLEVRKNPNEKRQVVGLISLPAKYYPVALLLFVQLLFPGASWLGHISGIAVGYFVAMFEAYIVMPWFLKRIEEHSWLKKMREMDSYVPIPSDNDELPRYNVVTTAQED